MNIGEVVAVVLIALTVGFALFYLFRAKKTGKKCIGCPYASSCSGKCSSKNNDSDSLQQE